MFKGIELKGRVPPARLIDLSVETVLQYASRVVVLVPTHSGQTARSIARFRLPVWIIAVCSQEAACQHLQFSYGVHPVFESERPENWNGYIRDWLKTHAVTADLVVLTQGRTTRDPEANYRMEIVELSRRPSEGLPGHQK
jgi:pyruvate kinase